MGLPKARGPQSIQVEGLRTLCRAYCSKLQATRTDLFFGAGDKQGRLRYHRLSLCRAHIAALSLELLGISHHGTDLESRSHGLSEGTAGCRKPRRRVARGSPFRLRIHRHWLSAACQIRGCEVAFGAREMAWGDLGR
eukprot:scaffold15221_cov35-Phaeocystis_antarctica.AAC.3